MSSITTSPFLEPGPLQALTGSEPILPGIMVRDLWAWAMGDLRLNTNRGALAQFLVANAVGDDRLMDDGWGNFDVRSETGITIEVKSSAYWQSWKQTRPSDIKFSGLMGKPWSEETGYGPESIVRADVFVFALNTCVDHRAYDPLRLTDWQFFVVPGYVIQQRGMKSISLGPLKRLAPPPVSWDGIADAVRLAAAVKDVLL